MYFTTGSTFHVSFVSFRLLENIRVKRAGYAFRQKYAIFLFRYKMLCASTWPNYAGSIFTHLITNLKQNLPTTVRTCTCTSTCRCCPWWCSTSVRYTGFQFGRVRFRSHENFHRKPANCSYKIPVNIPQIIFIIIYTCNIWYQLITLETARKEKLHDLATIVQKRWRGYRDWKRYQTMRAAEIKIASVYRMHRVRVAFTSCFT